MINHDWATAVEVAQATHDLMLEEALDPAREPVDWFVMQHKRHQCTLCADAYVRDMMK